MLTTAHSRQTARRAFLLVALIVAGAPVASSQGAPATPQSAAISEFRQRMRANPAADTVGGATVAVVVGDSVIWAEGFGWADREKRIPAGVETIYRIGSLSKTFTAVVLAQLIDRRVVSLDDPVERYLPEIRGLANPRAGTKPITLRQLASHTAGIIREPRLEGAAAGPIAQWEAKVLASIPATSFDTTPGARYAYSNIGFGILGLALSRAARTPFMTLVEDGVFTPLAMTSSTYIINDRLKPNLSVGYQRGPNGVDAKTPELEHLGRGYKVPNGGIYSTVKDLARFMGALSGASKPVSSDSMRRAMLTRQTPPGPGGYGLGVTLSQNGNAGHGGSVAGYTAFFEFDPATKVGVIMLSNGRANVNPPALLDALKKEMATPK